MKTFHNLLISIMFSEDDLPDHYDDEFLKKFGYAILREARGQADKPEDTVKLVTAGIGKDEVYFSYYKPLSACEKREDGTTIYYLGARPNVDHVVASLTRDERPFVMGLVKHNDGTWGCHS